jgi:FSR family fosmidomycin resistance protein-like MFS transporter
LTDTALPPPARTSQGIVLPVILAVSFCHMINDVMQSLLSALYPMLKDDYHLDFWQIGLLTFTFQVTASLLQPAIGFVTDRKPMPRSLPFGMATSVFGLMMLAFAGHYWLLLAGAALIGIGSAVFHPESSRIARLASGGRFGFAQSTFQVGGNFGQSLGPLLAAFIVVPFGQTSVAWFAFGSFMGIFVLWQVGTWYKAHRAAAARRPTPSRVLPFSRRRVVAAILILVLLTATKNVYIASLSSYYTFYVIEKFGVTVQYSQILLFWFLGASALGIVIGGLVGDHFGPKKVIWFSILGVLPFTLALPYADLFWIQVLTVLIGLIFSSAFSAIVVLGQELVPGRVGFIAGMFFGFAFGMAGIGAALLGIVADYRGIDFVFTICSFLPLLGILTVFLPDMRPPKPA